MANEIRLRSNFQSGTITDNPLTNVATTINSAAFANLPAVTSTSHLPIIMDPLATAGAPEIVYITAHTASATSATVIRGQEGTSARQHASGMTWRHAGLVSDYDSVLGYAQVTANQTGITSAVDLTGLSVTAAVPYGGHRIKVTGFIDCFSSVADDTASLTLLEDGTQVARWNQLMRPLNSGQGLTVMAIRAPSAASHTWKLQLARAVGTGSFTMEAGATLPAFILVEDLGPAA